MNSNILRSFCNDFQYKSVTKDGDFINKPQSFVNLVHEIIRDNVEFSNDGYSLFVSSLSKIEKQLLLSYILEISDYEYYLTNNLLDAAISEYEKELQAAIDNEIDQVWHEDMQEMGLHLNRHNDNNEIYYTR